MILVAFGVTEAIISILLAILGFVLGYFVRVWQRETEV
jgi:uncharacterized membrane protein YqaE (UPF0057 family)